MYQYDEECVSVFLKRQRQLFDEPVAETQEEAEAFLEDCMAQIAGSIEEVREILSADGMDVKTMTKEELLDAAEIFPLSKGRYLIVEG